MHCPAYHHNRRTALRICICDDDPVTVEYLSDSIRTFLQENYPKTCEISTFQSGTSLLEDRNPKDLVFLDIEMPDVNGIHVGQQLVACNKDVIIIFVTSHDRYLDDAMDLQVLRYLSKPIEEERLIRSLQKALEAYSNMTATLPIETKEGVYTIHTSDIVAIEAVDHEVIVHTVDGDYHTVQNMQYWLDRLPSGMFFQSHRSFIVNFAHVTDFDHTVIHLYRSQFTAYLTRRKYTDFKKAFLLYAEAH